MATMYFVLCLLALTPYLVIGDVYMHNMRGSNNRLNENSVNTQNQNRLFDSQNNAKGGYLCGESNPTDPFVAQPMRYFEGSKLPIEWTNQHGCGANYNSHCEIILQYMCDSGSKTYNGQTWGVTDGTDTNGGRHEPAAYRTKCETRSRNKGLWIADRNLNGDTAAFTRQNNNGNKYGTECPEERDYYPYWHPTPWKDIAVLTSNVSRCDYYKKESMNVIGKYECECTNWQTTSCSSTCWQYNNANECNQNTQCTWVMKTHGNQFRPNNELESNIGAPDCKEAPWSRDNHLGDVIGLGNMGYNWTMPSPQQACGSTQCNACVLRIRYNITTTDLDGLQKWQVTDVSPLVQTTWELDSNYNGAKKIRMVNPNADSATVTYYSDNPTVDIGSGSPLNIALDTDQNPRAFQDRSHTWKLASRPADIPSTATIWNLNVRGKRGNIVQAYPAVEYDFIPNYLQIYEGDYVHLQWVGSNRNPNGNAGQGNTPNDRNNFMEIDNLNANVPLPISRWRLFTPDTEKQYIKAFATGDTSGTRTNIDNQLQNVSPYFDGYQAYGNKFLQPKVGIYYYMCSRNNNFTNRSQKGTIVVKPASERPSN